MKEKEPKRKERRKQNRNERDLREGMKELKRGELGIGPSYGWSEKSCVWKV